MVEVLPNYYEVLGVSRDTTEKDIARAHSRKRRECENEDELILVTQAYETLRDKSKRDEYDFNMEYGTRIADLEEKFSNSKNFDEKIKYIEQIKKIYINSLEKYKDNTFALLELANIEIFLKNKELAIDYLLQTLQYMDDLKKLDIYSKLGKLSEELKRFDDAIVYYQHIQEADVSRIDEVIRLVRLYYKKKSNLNKAIQVLYNCLSRANNTIHKMRYSYEILRAIRISESKSNPSLEKSIYKKLGEFRSKNEEEYGFYSIELFSYLMDALRRNDFECCYKLEEILLNFGLQTIKIKELYGMYKKIFGFKEKKLIHKAIDLCIGEEWEDETKKEFGILILKQAEKIKVSLNLIKKEVPLFFELYIKNTDLEALIDDMLLISREYKVLEKDQMVSVHLKDMLKYRIIAEFIGLEVVLEDFVKEGDLFFEGESASVVQKSIKRFKTNYPQFYAVFEKLEQDYKDATERIKSNTSTTSNNIQKPKIDTSSNSNADNPKEANVPVVYTGDRKSKKLVKEIYDLINDKACSNVLIQGVSGILGFPFTLIADGAIIFTHYGTMLNEIRKLYGRKPITEDVVVSIVKGISNEILFDLIADKALGQIPVIGIYFNAITAKTMTWRLGILFAVLSARGEEINDKNVEATVKMIRLMFPQQDIFSFKQPYYDAFEKMVLSVTESTMEDFDDKVNRALDVLGS